MRLTRAIARWWRARQRAANAITFDALVERAKKQVVSKSLQNARPDYLPRKGAAGRTGLAVAGGLCLYAAIATFIPASIWSGWWWLLTIAVVPLVAFTAWMAEALERSLVHNGICTKTDGSEPWVRIIFWPIGEMGCVLFGWLGCYTYYGIGKIADWWRDRRAADSVARSAGADDAVRRVPDIIIEIVQGDRERLFGEKSPFAALHARIEAELKEARRLHAYFARRQGEAGRAERRTAAIERAIAACDRLDVDRARLDTWRAQVEAELDAYRERVRELDPEIDEFIHYQQLSHLEASAAALAEEAESLIAGMAIELLSRVQGRCAELSDALCDASVKVAVAAAATQDADRDDRILTETVAELVRRVPTYEPDKIHEEFRRLNAAVRQ